jgi:NADPH:quinone reductase-like Zn-dependent oxidoreductase
MPSIGPNAPNALVGVVPDLIELTGDPSHVLSIGDFRAGELGAKVSVMPGDRTAALAEVARLFEQGEFHLHVARTFTLEQAAQAQEASAAGHVAGRFVVVIARS